ncbi:unnamed protein product [Cochlearia groenlandica]
MIHQALALPRLSNLASFTTVGFNRDLFLHQCSTKNSRIVSCSSGDDDQIASSMSKKKTRKVVEHLCLLKAKENLSEEEEKNMLDYLYTSQYQMRGIVAISVGNIGNRKNGDYYTHGLFMRFQKKEDLEKFYENPLFLKVLDKHVTPFCHEMINVDYESQVEDDILSIFRKGEEYNYGEEFILLVTFANNTSEKNVEDAMDSFAELTSSLPSLIVQSTQGSNFNNNSKEFTHAAIVRFRSFDAMEIFVEGREYKDMWRSIFEPFIEKVLALHFSVDPIGTDIM